MHTPPHPQTFLPQAVFAADWEAIERAAVDTGGTGKNFGERWASRGFCTDPMPVDFYNDIEEKTKPLLKGHHVSNALADLVGSVLNCMGAKGRKPGDVSPQPMLGGNEIRVALYDALVKDGFGDFRQAKNGIDSGSSVLSLTDGHRTAAGSHKAAVLLVFRVQSGKATENMRTKAGQQNQISR